MTDKHFPYRHELKMVDNRLTISQKDFNTDNDVVRYIFPDNTTIQKAKKMLKLVNQIYDTGYMHGRKTRNDELNIKEYKEQ